MHVQGTTVDSGDGGSSHVTSGGGSWRVVREHVGCSVPRAVLERAGELRDRVLTGDVWERDTDAVTGGSFLVACREARVPVLVSEISDVTGADRGVIVTVSRVIQRCFDVRAPPVDAAVFIDRFTGVRGVTDDVEVVAREVAAVCDAHGVASGRAPRVVAAASVYVAADVVGETGVGAVTQSGVAGVIASSARVVRDVVRVIRDAVTVTGTQRGDGAPESSVTSVSVVC